MVINQSKRNGSWWGSLDLERKWLVSVVIDENYNSLPNINLWMQFLYERGLTGSYSLNDLKYCWLKSLGYDGSIEDMLSTFIKDNGPQKMINLVAKERNNDY